MFTKASWGKYNSNSSFLERERGVRVTGAKFVCAPVSVSTYMTVACRRGFYIVVTFMYPHWAAPAPGEPRLYRANMLRMGRCSVNPAGDPEAPPPPPHCTSAEVGPGDGAELGPG